MKSVDFFLTTSLRGRKQSRLNSSLTTWDSGWCPIADTSGATQWWTELDSNERLFQSFFFRLGKQLVKTEKVFQMHDVLAGTKKSLYHKRSVYFKTVLNRL